MTTTTRHQQDRVYAAENTCDVGRRFATLDDVRDWVTKLRSTSWWERLYARVEMIEVRARRRRDGSLGTWFPDQSAGLIELSPDHRNERDVVHELAHVLAAALHDSSSHCPWYARVYCELTYLARGSEAYVALTRAFDAHGVDYRQKG